MNRGLAVIAAAFAALVFTMQSADAGNRDPRLFWTSIGVGAASTAGYFGLKNTSVGSGGAFALTTVGCAAASPIVGTLAVNRPLKYREAHALVGACVVPVIGGWLVNEAYNAGWLWAPDEKPKKARYRKRK